jgi:hypothetical protein
LDEGLRRDEFAFIDFRDSPVGRQAFVHGSRLAVWQVCKLVREQGGDIRKTARHLEWPAAKVRAAMNYVEAFPDEVEEAIRDSGVHTFASIARLLPHAEEFVVSAGSTRTKTKKKRA